MNKKWTNSALNCEAYFLFIYLFILKECLPTTELSRQKYVWTFTWMRRKQPKPHIMTNPCLTIDIRDEDTIKLRNKFDALQEIWETLTSNDEYENFVNAPMETAAECIPTKLRAKHRVTWETLAVKKKSENRIPMQ